MKNLERAEYFCDLLKEQIAAQFDAVAEDVRQQELNKRIVIAQKELDRHCFLYRAEGYAQGIEDAAKLIEAKGSHCCEDCPCDYWPEEIRALTDGGKKEVVYDGFCPHGIPFGQCKESHK